MDDLVNELPTGTDKSLRGLGPESARRGQDPNDPYHPGNILRLIRTIRDTRGLFGLPRLKEAAHAAERLLDKARAVQTSQFGRRSKHRVPVTSENRDEVLPDR